ncbi:MAG: L,D-transpeptidase [Bacilli bacterium]
MQMLLSLVFVFTIWLRPLGDAATLLIVNKQNNKLAVVVDEKVVATYPVATGRSSELTPEGKFTVQLLAKDPYFIKADIPGGDPKNPLGSRWIGFDALGTNGSKYGVHGTNAPWSIGTYASSGCVRMHNADVEKVFDYMKLGDSVYIVSSSKSWSALIEQYYNN